MEKEPDIFTDMAFDEAYTQHIADVFDKLDSLFGSIKAHPSNLPTDGEEDVSGT